MSEHKLLRLDIMSKELRRAHCTCGASAVVMVNTGKVWVRLHALRPDLDPGELATHFSEQLFGEKLS